MKPTDDVSRIPENGMSTTPRTDAAVQRHRLLGSGPFELEGRFADFARALETELAAMTLRAEKAEAELAAERARHNALRQAVFDVLCDPEGRACFHGSDADRATIDSAMKEASK